MTDRFRAMNTDVNIVLPAAHTLRRKWLVHHVRKMFARSETQFSRFRSNSELALLNRSGGLMSASEDLFGALQRAHHYWQLTDGWFDPSITPALCRAGYDRSFAPRRLDSVAAAPPVPWRSAMPRLVLHAATRSVDVPGGAVLDFGGFIKGWTVDRASRRLPGTSAINAGGDAYLKGHWQISVEDPTLAGTSLMCLKVHDRGVATSGINRRRWRHGPRQAHHLIDPWTGLPSESDLQQVTVVARSTELADVLAKTALLRGRVDGARFLQKFVDVNAVLVSREGDPLLVGEFDANECEVLV